MSPTQADLILHPLRMRILLAVAGQRLTAQEIARHLPDVAQATLYRHINVLAKAGLLVVVEERPVRGTQEKVYAVADQAGRLTGADARTMTTDDHRRYFTAFVSSLLSDFSRYLSQHPAPDPAVDGVRYSKGTLYLSADELATLTQQIQTLLGPFATPRPTASAERRTFALVLLPEAPPVRDDSAETDHADPS